MSILKLPKQTNQIREDRISSAPYNFVPLPEKVVTAVDDPEKLPGHDSYANEGYPHTGYFDVMLTTQSPLYVRGMPTRAEFDLDEQGMDRHGKPIKNGVTLFADRLKNNPDFFHTGNVMKPVIPGSSLRGMLRSMVEIVSYSKFGPLSKSPKITFRAVAAPVDDPLSTSYYSILGKYGRDVSAGYLVKHDKKWKIRPAKRPASLGLSEKGAYLKVKDIQKLVGAVPGLKRFDDKDYKPQFHSVSFKAEPKKDKQGRKYTAVTEIGDEQAKYPFKGTLVCSGNMLETSEEGQKSPRVNYSLVLEPDTDSKTVLIEISEETLTDYADSLTPFLKEPPFDPLLGCLIENRPVFYVERDGKALWFGHCPNFRVPAFLKNTSRVATPADFLPSALCQNTDTDFADAIFGYVARKKHGAMQGSKTNAYAGRVSVSDAMTTQTDVFLSETAFPPEILATPKPTAFQHYLVQKRDSKRDFSHYGSFPGEAAIRGSKMYWKQGDRTVADLRAKPNMPGVDEAGNVEKTSTQHTLLKPMRSGVRFTFRVYFENLSDVELGALCWALHPRGDERKTYCHQLGMGKPLGMGAVKLDATLHLNSRKDRYESLFAGEGWATGYEGEALSLSAGGEKLKGFTDAFERRVLDQLNNPCEMLAGLKRIGILLKLMEWDDAPPAGRSRTQTLEEFKQRRVLPDPTFNEPALENLAGPTPTQNAVADAASRNDAGAARSPSGGASQSGMGNALGNKHAQPATVQQRSSTAKETVTLVGQIKNGRAQVRTEQGEQITCEKMPSFNAPKPGEQCTAKVERKDGNAIKAVYVP